MSTLPWLDTDNVQFPSDQLALTEPNGLLAAGGDLSPERLINAYRLGIFPWYEQPDPILWWSPSPRTVLFPDRIHISRSLNKRLRQQRYQVSCDQQFQQVVACCANVPRQGQAGSWIGSDMFEAYQRLHDLGIAHSLEVWFEGQLIGGLYGLAIGRVFFGESMFSLRSDASKVAFVYLARQLQNWDFGLIDCQVSNPHLSSLGAEELDRSTFNQLLKKHIDLPGPESWPQHWPLINPQQATI